MPDFFVSATQGKLTQAQKDFIIQLAQEKFGDDKLCEYKEVSISLGTDGFDHTKRPPWLTKCLLIAGAQIDSRLGSSGNPIEGLAAIAQERSVTL